MAARAAVGQSEYVHCTPPSAVAGARPLVPLEKAKFLRLGDRSSDLIDAKTAPETAFDALFVQPVRGAVAGICQPKSENAQQGC
jgi:hypothetical protein